MRSSLLSYYLSFAKKVGTRLGGLHHAVRLLATQKIIGALSCTFPTVRVTPLVVHKRTHHRACCSANATISKRRRLPLGFRSAELKTFCIHSSCSLSELERRRIMNRKSSRALWSTLPTVTRCKISLMVRDRVLLPLFSLCSVLGVVEFL